MTTFKAIVIEKSDTGTKAALTDFDEANLMDGDVTVRVEYSTVNYKDGLAVTGRSPVVRRFPMIAGIDFAGTVETSSHPAWKPGDKVILTGWGCGETHLGAYGEKARVKGDWLVPLPSSMSAREAMAIGTAGFTAMLAVMALEGHGLTPERGPIAVTGAAGGVGSVAVAILAKRGFCRQRGHRPSTGGRVSQGTGRGRNRRAQGPGRAAQSAGQGTLGRGGRLRRLDHARQSAVDDPLWGGGGRLRTCRRHGPAGLGGPVYSPWRVSLRHQFGNVPGIAPPRGVETSGKRPGSPKTGLNDP